MAQRQFRSDDTSRWQDKYGYGGDGAKVVSSNGTYDGARASMVGTSGASTATLGAASSFANGDIVIIHQSRGAGVGEWELNKIIAGGGTTSVTLRYPLIRTYTDSGADQAQMVEFKQYSSLVINSGVTWSPPGWDGDTGGILPVIVNGLTTVTGTISAGGAGGAANSNPAPGGTGGGYRGGAGQDNGSGDTGEGTVGASVADTPNANGSGGGGTHAGSNNPQEDGGGGGGHATAGAAGTGNTNAGALPGSGGGTSGNAGLTNMTFGGGGGGGSHDTGGSGGGGSGGGIILIISRRLTVTGSITVNGGPGGARSGGGGAGGSILLKFQVGILGSNLVTATGGVSPGPAGHDGGTGRIHADYSRSISGTTSPTIDSRQDNTLRNRPGAAVLLMQL